MATRNLVEELQSEAEERLATGKLTDPDAERLSNAELVAYVEAANGDVAEREQVVGREFLRRYRKRLVRRAGRAAPNGP